MESRHQSSSLLNNDNYQKQQQTPKSKKSLSNKQFEGNYRNFSSANKNIKAKNITQYPNLTSIPSKYQKTFLKFNENGEENNEYRSYLNEKKDNHINSNNNNNTRKTLLSTVFLNKDLTSIKNIQDVDNKNNKHLSSKINHPQLSLSAASFQNFNLPSSNDKYQKQQKRSEDSNKLKSNTNNDNNESQTLLEWVENELDRYGIDQVIFGRNILALLQQCSNNNNITYLDDNSNYEVTDTDSGYNSITTNTNAKFINRYQIIGNKRPNFRYCESHRENKINFYNNQGKFSLSSLANRRPKDNAQKPPSTTKWMHKRYLQQANNNNNDNFDDNCIFDDQCPECQYQRQKQVKDERKFMLVQCLKSASGKVCLYIISLLLQFFKILFS